MMAWFKIAMIAAQRVAVKYALPFLAEVAVMLFTKYHTVLIERINKAVAVAQDGTMSGTEKFAWVRDQIRQEFPQIPALIIDTAIQTAVLKLKGWKVFGGLVK